MSEPTKLGEIGTTMQFAFRMPTHHTLPIEGNPRGIHESVFRASTLLNLAKALMRKGLSSGATLEVIESLEILSDEQKAIDKARGINNV